MTLVHTIDPVQVSYLVSQSYYRGARSALKLKKIDEALSLCEEGLKMDPINEDLKKLTKVNYSLAFSQLSPAKRLSATHQGVNTKSS